MNSAAACKRELKQRGDLAAARARGEEPQRLSHGCRRMGGETWLRGDPRRRKNPFDTEQTVPAGPFPGARCGDCGRALLERKRGGAPERGQTPPQTPQQLIDETLKLGHGTLFALDNHRQADRPFDGSGVSRLRPFLRAAGSEKFQLQLRRKAGVRNAAVSANCFICPMSSAARARTPSRNPGSDGRKANANFARSATARD